MKFTVLMSIYNKEKVEYFNRAMESIYDEQTIKPSEIVLVRDGPLYSELDSAIDIWKEKLGNIFKIIALNQNMGLGDALNIGLNHCSHELIARMDTDDISAPDRFEKQLKVFENNDIDICSSWVSEFGDNENIISSYRKLPEVNEDISKYFQSRNAINHPAVMYKKSIIEKVGGYQQMIWFEDYYLWARMLLSGARFYNIQEPLVNMRAGYGQLERRGGFKYAIAEVKFLNRLREIGFLSTIQFIKNVSIRFIVRLMPKALLKLIYKKIRG